MEAVKKDDLTRLHASEVAAGARFEFGRNWATFLETVDDQRIGTAEASLKTMLEVGDLRGKRFLDVGSGSGLFSLAARRLGARVHSFDYDPQSVACTAELRRRYVPADDNWVVEQGSALDADYLKSLGEFDVVYAWGVLHATGAMWRALELVALPVAPGGKLFVAIYNDTGTQSARWKWIKRTYNSVPRFGRVPFAVAVSAPSEIKEAVGALLAGRLPEYLRSWTRGSQARGMSRWHDIVDWVGGYPYEVARPEEVFDFYRARGFTLTRLKTGRVGLGCNELVFEKAR